MFKPVVAVLAMSVASLGLSPRQAFADDLPHVNFCTGAKDGNYDFVGVQLAQQARGSIHGTLINTAGSMQNLEKLDKGECDAAIVQSDAYNLYMKQNTHSTLTLERGRVLYPEYVHMICNTASGISSIDDLKSGQTVLIGPNGSGSAVTWENFKLSNPKRFEHVSTLPIGGPRAAGQVQEGSDATCMFAVIGLKAPGIMAINDVGKTSDGRMRLVNAQDSDILAVKDSKGRQVYHDATIPGGTYSALQPGFFSTSVSTISVDSIFVANSNWVDANQDGYAKLLTALNNAMPAINNRVKPQ